MFFFFVKFNVKLKYNNSIDCNKTKQFIFIFDWVIGGDKWVYKHQTLTLESGIRIRRKQKEIRVF